MKLVGAKNWRTVYAAPFCFIIIDRWVVRRLFSHQTASQTSHQHLVMGLNWSNRRHCGFDQLRLVSLIIRAVRHEADPAHIRWQLRHNGANVLPSHPVTFIPTRKKRQRIRKTLLLAPPPSSCSHSPVGSNYSQVGPICESSLPASLRSLCDVLHPTYHAAFQTTQIWHTRSKLFSGC